jgi:hypothetical protein
MIQDQRLSRACIVHLVIKRTNPQVIVLTQDHMGKYRNIFFFEAIALIEPKLCINHWKILYKLCVFYVDRNSKMTTTAGPCSGGHLGFPIDIKNPHFVEDLPMIILGQFGLNCPSRFRIKAKLYMNVHWMVFYKF